MYEGSELAPCTEYYVKIIVKNNLDETADYRFKFETAFLSGEFSPWEGAEFIGAPNIMFVRKLWEFSALKAK